MKGKIGAVSKLMLFAFALLIAFSFFVLAYKWIVSPTVEKSIAAGTLLDAYKISSYISLLSTSGEGEIEMLLSNKCDVKVEEKSFFKTFGEELKRLLPWRLPWKWGEQVLGGRVSMRCYQDKLEHKRFMDVPLFVEKTVEIKGARGLRLTKEKGKISISEIERLENSQEGKEKGGKG